MSKLKSIREIEMERAAAPNFGKGITVASGFDLGAKAPLDSRLTVKTIEERDAHVTGNRSYEGMLVYVEADKKTYQLIDNTWEEFGFNEEKFQAGLAPVIEKNEQQDERLDILESLVIGGEGEGLDSIIADVAETKAGLAKEIEDRTKADEDLLAKISANETSIESLEAKDVELLNKITANTTAVEKAQTEVDAVEVKVAANETNIAKNASDLQAEITRAKGEEAAIRAELAEAIEGVAGDNSALEERVTTAEGKIAENTSAINKEVSDREAAISSINSKISEMDAAYKNADTTINGRLDALEGATADLEEIRNDIEANATAITAEVTNRTEAVKSVDDKITAEVTRATQAEQALGVRIDGVISDVEELTTAVNTKTAQALTDAKAYTDEKVAEINTATSELEGRVEANETALGLVDGKIATAKTEALNGAKSYTNAEIAKIDSAYKAADTQVLADAKSYAEGKVDEAKTTLEASISAVDTKVTEVVSDVTDLTSRVAVNESDIANIKDALSNKNSSTIVVDTEAEIATENPTPKVGDMAYVISSKRAYIFKGVAAIAVESVPAGWVVFDEITSELDLVDYLKKEDAEGLYRRKDVKIVEADLHDDLAGKLNAKADKSYVDGELAKKTNEAYVNSKVEEVVAPVRTATETNASAIAKEVSDRQSEITRVEGIVTTKVQEVNTSLTETLNEKEAELKAENVALTNRLNNMATVVSNKQPVGTEVGHVWLELV